MGVNATNHFFLTARDAGTDEAHVIGVTPAFCNKSIKSPFASYMKMGRGRAAAIHFNKGCRLEVQRDKDGARKTICKSHGRARQSGRIGPND